MSVLLTAEELAQRLRLQPSTVKRWAQEGIIPALRLSGKVVRYDWEAVENALREHAARR
jgi:excisionase family DNA binding protein